MVLHSKTVEARFVRFISKQFDGCWKWMGAQTAKGYGQFKLNGSAKAAHRVSYELWRGAALDLHVLHNCQNPWCVNPEHLRLGTNKENHEEKAALGRGRQQEFSSEKVKEVLALAKEWQYPATIAKKAGISRVTVIKILKGQYHGTTQENR